MNFSAISDILTDYRQRGYYPSAVAEIFDSERTLFRTAVGDVSEDAWFDLASVSKIICTTLLLSVMDEGSLTPEDVVTERLPADRLGPVTRERLERITIRQLMTHTSGIVAWYPFYADGREFYTALEDVLRRTPVEQGMVYSDLNFMLLGLIFEHATGLSLREGLEHYIKKPLGITDIAYGPVDARLCAPSCRGNQIEQRMCAERGLSFQNWRPNGVVVQGACNDGNAYYYWHGASGHAGVFANSGALTKLCQYYMTTRKPVFLRAMRENVFGRGLGFDKSDVFPDGCGHTGFTGTSLWLSREHNCGAVILTNKFFREEGTPPGNSNEFRRAIHYALLGIEPPTAS